jgi:PAS domain S-box-containing protein
MPSTTRPAPTRPWLLRYAVAVAATWLALVLGLALAQAGASPAPFPLFLAAVMLSSWFGGLGPGLLSIAVGAMAIAYFYVSPTYSLRVASLRGAEELAVSVAVAILIGVLNNRRRRAEEFSGRVAVRMQTLAELAQTFAAANLDLRTTAETVARRTAEVLGDGCVLRLLADDGRRLEPIAAFHRDPDALSCLRRLLSVAPREAADGFADPVARSGQPLLIPVLRPDDPRSALGPHDRPDAEAFGASSLLIAPVRWRDRVVGTLTVWREGTGQAYTPTDQRFLQDLAEHAALAIANARLHQQVLAAEARYRSLFDGAADAILVSDEEGCFFDANPATTGLLGYAREELVRRRGRDLALGGLAWDAAEMARLRREGPWRGEFDARRKDGAPIPVEGSVAVAELPTGSVFHVTLRDISERRALERMRRDFVAKVTHDLRTPLTAIRAGLGALATTADPRLRPDERNLLANTRRNADRLGSLIEDLLALNQLDAGVLHLDRAALDLRTVATSAAAAVQALIQEKEQTLELDLPEPLPVDGDRRRLERVVINLLANAHRHTPAGTRIAVSGRVAAADVLLTVGDDGPGIAAEEVDRVFAPFYRLTPMGAGSGLGLAIVRGIVELHEGRVWVESCSGKGARFNVALPRMPKEDDRDRDADVVGGG